MCVSVSRAFGTNGNHVGLYWKCSAGRGGVEEERGEAPLVRGEIISRRSRVFSSSWDQAPRRPKCRPKIARSDFFFFIITKIRPHDAAKPLIYKIFENPAEGRPHYAAKPLIYKIFDNPAEGRPHDAAKPLIYKIIDNPAEGRTHDALFSANINGTRHYMDIRYVCISFPRFWH